MVSSLRSLAWLRSHPASLTSFAPECLLGSLAHCAGSLARSRARFARRRRSLAVVSSLACSARSLRSHPFARELARSLERAGWGQADFWRGTGGSSADQAGYSSGGTLVNKMVQCYFVSSFFVFFHRGDNSFKKEYCNNTQCWLILMYFLICGSMY